VSHSDSWSVCDCLEHLVSIRSVNRYDRYAVIGTEISRLYLESWASSILPHLRQVLGEKPGDILQGIDALALMSLCAFETQQPIYLGLGKQAPWSSWCDLYGSLGDERELKVWEGYAYWYVIAAAESLARSHGVRGSDERLETAWARSLNDFGFTATRYDITKWHIRGPGNPAAVKAGVSLPLHAPRLI
jgi:hypothetical protein